MVDGRFGRGRFGLDVSAKDVLAKGTDSRKIFVPNTISTPKEV